MVMVYGLVCSFFVGDGEDVDGYPLVVLVVAYFQFVGVSVRNIFQS